MYRPEGWNEKRACHEAMLKRGGIPVQALLDWRATYEAGADAMLEGLKEGGWVLTGDSIIPAIGEYPEIHVPSGMKGHLVFIPEGE